MNTFTQFGFIVSQTTHNESKHFLTGNDSVVAYKLISLLLVSTDAWQTTKCV
jgi:hypothetical protein